MNSPSSSDTMLQPMRMWRLSESDLYCVAMKMRRRPGVDAVAQREVDDAVRPAEVDRRLGAFLGQRIEPLAGAAGEHDDEAVVEQRRHDALSSCRSTTRAGAPSAPTIRERQAEHLVDARLDVAQVQAFDDDRAAAEQRRDAPARPAS